MRNPPRVSRFRGRAEPCTRWQIEKSARRVFLSAEGNNGASSRVVRKSCGRWHGSTVSRPAPLSPLLPAWCGKAALRRSFQWLRPAPKPSAANVFRFAATPEKGLPPAAQAFWFPHSCSRHARRRSISTRLRCPRWIHSAGHIARSLKKRRSIRRRNCPTWVSCRRVRPARDSSHASRSTGLVRQRRFKMLPTIATTAATPMTAQLPVATGAQRSEVDHLDGARDRCGGMRQRSRAGILGDPMGDNFCTEFVQQHLWTGGVAITVAKYPVPGPVSGLQISGEVSTSTGIASSVGGSIAGEAAPARGRRAMSRWHEWRSSRARQRSAASTLTWVQGSPLPPQPTKR